ncbi:MAG: phosphogluconate dehydrogenase (NAD(+)-dependent, decarboxylating), partial [Actinomycetota bacterium]
TSNQGFANENIAPSPDAVERAVVAGAEGAATLAEMCGKLPSPKVVWLMVPAGEVTEGTVRELGGILGNGDVIVDGGNSNWQDSKRRAQELAPGGIGFLDCGTSGGVWGLENGYCLMVGGDDAAVAIVEPAFHALAPNDGYAHVGPSGAGHFVKMVHNGIEYGLLAAYGEGFEILEKSSYDLDLERIAGIWRYGSVVRSWLLELLHDALANDPGLASIRGYVDDSGEGRWTLEAAMDENVPAPITALALFLRYASRQDDSFSAKVIAALRNEFGGHAVKPEGPA